MLALEFISWWYSAGWLGFAKRLFGYLTSILHYFSVALLLKTLFAPWKRITSYGKRSLNERLRALLDNLIARLVGFSVRFMVLFVALILSTVGVALSFVCLVLWPLLPVAVPLLVVRMLLP